MLKKLRKWLFSLLTGYDLSQFEAYTRSMRTLSGSMNGGLDDTYLFDFKNYGSLYLGGSDSLVTGVPINSQVETVVLQPSGTVLIGDGGMQGAAGQPESKKVPAKIAIKPVDVLKELETMPTPFSLSNLDDKIAVLRQKEKMIVQHYAKREISGLIQRLENRKKYMQFKTYFEGFQNTDDAKIDAFIAKHGFVMKTSDIFLPEFPNDAVEVMKSYTEKMNEVCGKKPVFYVIAMQDQFRKAYEQRDPILLVQSPFGFYWQILGAWDKEMLLLGEL